MERLKSEGNGPMLDEFGGKKKDEDVLDKYQVEDSKKRGLQKWRCLPGMEDGAQKQNIQSKRKW